ncbi:MAG: aryl-sulfate sulfotransferase [Cyclobacteriaceae bacterium]
MKTLQNTLLHLLLVTLMLTACQPSSSKLEDILKGRLASEVNPFKKSPLGAQLKFRTEEPCKVTIKVPGKIPVIKSFETFQEVHQVSVLGLYPDTTNQVELILTTADEKTYTGIIPLKTQKLPDFLPSVEVTKVQREKMEDGMHLVEMLIANNGRFHSYTIMFDDNGDIRFVMDMSHFGQISYSNLRLTNGNWLYLSWINLLEVTELGETVKEDRMWMYAADHDMVELKNDQLLMGGSKKDAKVVRADGLEPATRYDYVVKWDRLNNRGIQEWDLGAVLDIDRSVFPEDYNLDFKADWFHINSVAITRDSSILASGRNQGVVKLDQENNLKWILAPHLGWGKAGRTGNGFETSDYLLTAIDADGKPLSKDVQMGYAGTDSFEWPTGQHAVTELSNGNIMLFDNGLSRNFAEKPTYSRAVEYKINEENMTIQQVWQYGKSRGLDMYSHITSEVDLLPNTKNRLITAGNIRASGEAPHSKLVEITYPENEVVFEAKVIFKDAKSTGQMAWGQLDLVYRGERYSLYH